MTDAVQDRPVFSSNSGCPFCGDVGKAISRVSYHDTAEANRTLPDVVGTLYDCQACGVAYPSHSYAIDAFPLMYSKSFADHSYFNRSVLQTLRKRFIKAVLSGHRVLDHLSMHVLQIPLVPRSSGMKVLDVGCGFGEFMDIFRDLGNAVTGTEVIPNLVEICRRRGHDVKFGELEALEFAGSFDLIILRAVLYRTRDPRRTLQVARSLLAEGGQIALLDPCPRGSDYFFRKQFPQGQFYITNPERYFQVLRSLGFQCLEWHQIYGRPTTPCKPVRHLGNIKGLIELLAANLLGVRPYVLNYRLARVA
jgi:SAM-dependent methyltransferase